MDPGDRSQVGDTGVEPPPVAPASAEGSSWGMKLFLAVVILGFIAGGVAGIKTYLEKSEQAEALEENGIATDADVMSVTEISGRRIETYHKLRVSYDPRGSEFLAFAEVQDCSGARYESGVNTVRVVYLADDPDVIRLEACRSNFDSDKFPGIIGIVFLAFALFMLWRVRGVWRG